MATTAINPTEAFPTAFPTLSPEDILQLEQYASCEVFQDGEMIFEAGQEEIDLFVVKSGKLEILNPADDHSVVVTHEKGHFSGDIDLLTRRPVIVSGRAKGVTNVLRVKNKNLREVLHRVPKLSEKLLVAFSQRRELLNGTGRIGLKVIGYGKCSHTTMIREFLYKNFVPFTFYDVETANGETEHRKCGIEKDLPAVKCPDGKVLTQPTLREISQGAGIWRHCPTDSVDLAIIGAGPAGIAAAVYAASEGLSTLVLDRLGPGGQAGGSSRIENFIGFPVGLSGTDLATRGILQMLKFGAQLVAPVEVMSVKKNPDGPGHLLELDCGALIKARVVLIAAGVEWRKLEAENADRFERQGVYYACTSVEALLHDKSDVAVVGAGNSAGQAAVFLSDCCPSRKVHMIVRSQLGPSMSDYLTARIRSIPNIVVHEYATVTKVDGEMQVESINVQSRTEGEFGLPAKAVFVFIGSDSSHRWLPAGIARDDKGFLLTGTDVLNSGKWPLNHRLPCPLETTIPGILAAGDVRSGTTKRVGFAVGDGSQAVSCVHTLLAQDQG